VATSRETLTHLLACFDAVYRGLGESAPHLTNDADVVAVYEMGRSFGEVALALRRHLDGVDVAPLAVIVEVLERAARSDDTGAMTLYAMAHVVGPRLLVSLRDAREVKLEDPAVAPLLERAAQVCVAQLLVIADVTQTREAIDEPGWQEAARELRELVETAGNAESFGVSR
jgi:hypothetical protein